MKISKDRIIEGNELLAKFEGYVNTTPTDKDFNIFENDNGDMLESMSMTYHKDWISLMRIVEKIEDTMISDEAWVDVTIGCGKYCVVQDNVEGTFEFTGMEETKILSVWKPCVEFVEWYYKNM
jgi:hypothetical protein